MPENESKKKKNTLPAFLINTNTSISINTDIDRVHSMYTIPHMTAAAAATVDDADADELSTIGGDIDSTSHVDTPRELSDLYTDEEFGIASSSSSRNKNTTNRFSTGTAAEVAAANRMANDIVLDHNPSSLSSTLGLFNYSSDSSAAIHNYNDDDDATVSTNGGEEVHEEDANNTTNNTNENELMDDSSFNAAITEATTARTGATEALSLARTTTTTTTTSMSNQLLDVQRRNNNNNNINMSISSATNDDDTNDDNGRYGTKAYFTTYERFMNLSPFRNKPLTSSSSRRRAVAVNCRNDGDALSPVSNATGYSNNNNSSGSGGGLLLPTNHGFVRANNNGNGDDDGFIINNNSTSEHAIIALPSSANRTQLLNTASTTAASTSSSTHVSFWNRPQLAKHLFIVSMFLVACSVALGAAGLGMMYSNNTNNNRESSDNNGGGGGADKDASGGGEVIGELNELNEEQGLLLEVIVPPLDEEEERDVFGNSTGAKGRATDSPTTAPPEDTVIGEDTTTIITIDSITIDLDEPEIAAPGFPTLPPVEVVVEEEEEDPMIPVDTADTANKGDTTDWPTYYPTASPTISDTTEASSTATATTTTATASTTSSSSSTEELYSLSINPIADTWLEYNDTMAYGTKKRLKVDGHDPRATLLKFNITSLVAQALALNVTANDITGISLKLYSLTDSPFGGKVDILSSSCNDWDETQISWINAPSCMFDNSTQMFVGMFGEISSELTWNEAQLQIPGASAGVALDQLFVPELVTLRVSSHYADGVTYASREHSDVTMPELVVYYTVSDDDEVEEVVMAAEEEVVEVPVVDEAMAVIDEEEASDAEAVAPAVLDDMLESLEPSSSPSTSGEPTMIPTLEPTTYNPTEWPTYYPTSSPTINGTYSPTLSPSTKPEALTIEVSQDAMIRGGDSSNRRYGTDPFIALRGNSRKAVLEFDLSDVLERPNFDYAYTLRIFVSYVGEDEQRSVDAKYVNASNFEWDEESVTWNSFGEPAMEEIGWFSIYQSDSDTSVDIPLGSLPSVNGKLILVLEILDESTFDDDANKFDFRTKEFGSWAGPNAPQDTPPMLIAEPQFED